MFTIPHNELPVVRTRQALLALDLQNDIVSTGSILGVDQPEGFIESTVQLSAKFRALGDVVWIASTFEESRKINDARGEGEIVVTEAQIEKLERQKSSDSKRSRPRPSSSILTKYKHLVAQSQLDAQESSPAPATEGTLSPDNLGEDNVSPEDDQEAFLTVRSGRHPRCVLPATQGYNFVQPIISTIDSQRDMILCKTYYSAFKTTTLLQTLRKKMVTELFICGALTNISVFATALDAARHGYSITIVDDCCGHRSKSRHDEAIRQIIEATGCSVSSSPKIIEDLDSLEQRIKKVPIGSSNQPRDLQGLLKSLSLQQESSRAALAQIRDHRASPKLRSSTSIPKERPDGSAQQETGSPSGGKRRLRSKVKTRRRTSHPSTVDENQAAGTKEDLKGPENGKQMTLLPEKASSAPTLVQESSFSDKNIDKQARSSSWSTRESSQPTFPLEADNEPIVADITPEPICEGDTIIEPRLLEPPVADEVFTRIKHEIKWQRMLHQGGEVPRLVAVQGEVSKDGSIPVYRHPSDESPQLTRFSPTIKLIRAQVEKSLGHPVNHVLIQFYRDGTDYISEHSDKTLDIAPNTYIANVSFGAQRTMIFRTKKSGFDNSTCSTPGAPRRTEKVSLPHNSLCKVGLNTNMRWLHTIKQDKRQTRERSEAELAYNGERISLTFRLIGTFLNKDETKIWGQGATSKEKEDAKHVINGETPESQEMLHAFSTENKSSTFDWKAEYGGGFDVLHMSNSRKLYMSGDSTVDLRVQLMLAELDLSWAVGSTPISFPTADTFIRPTVPLKFRDNDPAQTAIEHDSSIMLYLDNFYNQQQPASAQSRSYVARQYIRFTEANRLLDLWRDPDKYGANIPLEIKKWAGYARENVCIAGEVIGIADFAALPVFKEISSLYGIEVLGADLRMYYERMMQRKSFAKLLGADESTV